MRSRIDVRLRIGSVVLGALLIALVMAVPAFAQTRDAIIKEAKYTNAVASELKSLQWTHFYGTFDRSVWAVLTIHDGSGREVARIFDGPVPEANKRFWFPSWNGKDKAGKYLPSSAGYEWRLKVNRGDRYDVASGRIAVCRVLFSLNGTLENPAANDPAKPAASQAWDRYLVEGSANVYVRVSNSTKSEGMFGFHMPGKVDPYRNPEPSVFFQPIQPDGQLINTYYLRSPNWDIQRGVQRVSVESLGLPLVTYQITVLQ